MSIAYDIQIDQLEKFLLSTNKEEFIQKLIPDTEIFYYFRLLHSIQTNGPKLSQDEEQSLAKLKQMKTAKAKSITLRYLMKLYDSSQEEDEKKQILRKINNKLLKIKFIEKKENLQNIQVASSNSNALPIRRRKSSSSQSEDSANSQENQNIEIDDSYEEQEEDELSGGNVDLFGEVQEEIKRDPDDSDLSEKDFKKDQAKHPITSQLDSKFFDVDKELKKIYKEPVQFSNLFLDQFSLIDIDSFLVNIKEQQDTYVIKDFLCQVDLANVEIESLTKLINRYIKINKGKNQNYVFDMTEIYGFLTIEQLEKIAVNDAEFIQHTKEYFGALYKKVFAHQIGENNQNIVLFSEKKILEHLSSLRDQFNWASKNSNSTTKNLQEQILFEYLQCSLETNQFDFKLFFEYLKNPQESLQFANLKLNAQQSQEPQQKPQVVQQIRPPQQQQQRQIQQQNLFQDDDDDMYQENIEQIPSEEVEECRNEGIFQIPRPVVQQRSANNYRSRHQVPLEPVNQTNNKKVENKVQDSYWLTVHQFNNSRWNQMNLIQSYIEEYFRINKSTDIQAFEEFFDQQYLKKILIKTRLGMGELDMDSNISEFLLPAEIKELQVQKKMKILDWNKRTFERDEPVVIFLEIKNVPHIAVKIFDIVTENYYLKNRSEFNQHIDLDGLTANEELSFNLSAELTHPCKSITQEFVFESIAKTPQGVFVVEFFGSGMASRLIIRKGQLIPLLRYTVGGNSVRLIDETGALLVPGEEVQVDEKQAVQKTPQENKRIGVWVDNQFYGADLKTSEIMIPYQKSSSNKQCIAVNGSFSQLINLDLQSQDYNFNCRYFYNKQTFLMGNRARVIVKPNLTLQNEKCNLDLIKDGNVTVTTTTDDGVPTVTKYENLVFSLQQDFVAEFPIPAKIIRIRIRVTGQIKKRSVDSESEYSHEHNINFDTYKGTNTFVQIFLHRSEIGGYNIQIVGKNGEPKPNLEVDLTLGSQIVRNNYTLTLKSNNNGVINLGNLSNFTFVQAKLKASGDILAIEQKWLVDEQYRRVKNTVDRNIYLIEGDDLKIPFYNQFVKTVNSSNIYFVRIKPSATPIQYDGNRQQVVEVLRNEINKLKVNEKAITVSKIEQGEYLLRIKNIRQNFRIKVFKEGVRWAYRSVRQSDEQMNQSLLITSGGQPVKFFDMLERNTRADNPARLDQLLFNEKQELEVSFKDIKPSEEKYARVHLLGFHTLPRNYAIPGDGSLVQGEKLDITQKNLVDYYNTYLSNRTLGDEFSYVLDRKSANRYTGNSLEKPSILVKRNFVKDTVQQKEELVMDLSYDDLDLKQCKKEEARALPRSYMTQAAQEYQGSYNHNSSIGGTNSNDKTLYFEEKQLNVDQNSENADSFLNFLQNPAVTLANLELDKNGKLVVPNFSLGGLSVVQLILITPFHSSLYTIPVPTPGPLETRDLTQKNNLARDKFYSIFRNSEIVPKSKNFIVNDITSTEYAIIDSIPGLFDLQSDLARFNGTYSSYQEKWAFLKRWSELTQDEKLLKFNDLMCHELNIFIYFKDRTFFNDVVAALIQNKIEKTFVDLFLLEKYKEILQIYDNIERYQELNVFEFCLFLIVYIQTKGVDTVEIDNIINQFENVFRTIPVDQEYQKRLFDLVLNREDKIKSSVGLISSNKKKISNTINNYDSDCSESIGSDSDEEDDDCNNDEDSYSDSSVLSGIEQIKRERRHSGIAMAQPLRRRHSGLMCEDEEEGDMDAGDIFGDYAEKSKPKSRQMRLGNKYAVNSLQSYNQTQQSQQNRFTGASGTEQQTKEYCERHYYDQLDDSYSHQLITINALWIQLSKYIRTNKGDITGFFSTQVLFATSSSSEMILALAVSDLSQSSQTKATSTKQGATGKEQIITAESNFFIYTKEIREGTPKLRNDILIAQRYYDPQNKYEYSEQDPNVYFEKDATEFLINKVYGCQVIVTNSNVSQQEMQILTEVPQGSIPVYNIEYTKSQNLVLKAYSTSILEFFFYFPSEGKFSIYPANASKEGLVYAVAKQKIFEVKKERVILKPETLDEILTKGSKDDILTFIETKNIFNYKIFKFSDIYHLLNDKEFYLQLLAILRRRRVFDYTIWSYSIYHGDHDSFLEFFNERTNRGKLNKYVNYIESSLIKTERVISGGGNGISMKLLEYYPLINSRVHLLKQDQANILNNEFKRHYLHFLRFITEKGTQNMDFADKISFVYYLLLQDRVDDALNIFNSISEREISVSDGGMIQFDYIQAYLDFYNGFPELKVAREVIEKYLDFPGIGWRNKFFEMANQLADYDGEEISSDPLVNKLADEKNQKSAKEKQAEKEILLDIKIENQQISIEHQNVPKNEVELQFFIIDLEVFFSKNPFLTRISDDFGFLKPTNILIAQLSEVPNGLQGKTLIDLPENLKQVNVFIQASTTGQKTGTTYFSNSLKVQVFEKQGQLQISDESDKPLSQVYIKCFSKQNNGTTSFHKDGYTDLRGRFDFISLSGDIDKSIEKFGLFAMSDELGSLIVECKAPQNYNSTDDAIKLVSAKWNNLFNQKQQNFQSKQK